MAQIQANPWLFTNADQASSVAISSIVSTGYSSLITTAAPHGLAENAPISVQGATTNPLYNAGYKIKAVPSTTTLIVAQTIPNLATNGANGNVLSAAYLAMIRIEQALWDQTTAGTALLITDTAGHTLWNPHATLADQPYNYGKLFWVGVGLVINTLPAGSQLQLTIN